jgi:CxxC-x17-CxxC domain-containing protein
MEILVDCFYTSLKYPSGRRRQYQMTLIIDDAGSGDLLFGVVIAAFRDETQEFRYDLIGVEFFQSSRFYKKEYLFQSSRIVSQLIVGLKIKSGEEIHICKSYIFDEAADDLRRTYGDDRVRRVEVTGEPQRLAEIAYLDEIRNLGYEPIVEREDKRAKSFFHMMRWLKENPDRLRYAKTGWPRLSRYHLFKSYHQSIMYNAVCTDCGNECEVPFKPDQNRPVYCQACWTTRRPPR